MSRHVTPNQGGEELRLLGDEEMPCVQLEELVWPTHEGLRQFGTQPTDSEIISPPDHHGGDIHGSELQRCAIEGGSMRVGGAIPVERAGEPARCGERLWVAIDRVNGVLLPLCAMDLANEIGFDVYPEAQDVYVSLGSVDGTDESAVHAWLKRFHAFVRRNQAKMAVGVQANAAEPAAA